MIKWTGATETASTFTVTVGEEDLSYTANFAACPVLTIKSNDTNMGSVSILPVQGEPMVAELVAKDLVGNETSISLPGDMGFFPTDLSTGTTEWTSNDGDIYIYGASKVIYYGNNSRYIGTNQIYFKDGNTYRDPLYNHLLWEGGVTRMQIYATQGEYLPEGVEEISFDEGTYSVVPGSVLTIKARPEGNYHLDSWTKDNVLDETNTSDSYVLTMGNQDMTLTANFMRNNYGLVVPNGRFATFCAAENIKLDPDQAGSIGLYTIAEVDANRTKATLTELSGVVEANTPMLVYNGSGAENLTVILIPTNEDANTDNAMAVSSFKGTTDPDGKTFSDTDLEENDYYTLSSGKVFAKATNPGTIGVNKCWLQFDHQQGGTGGSDARSIMLVFGDATGINEAYESYGTYKSYSHSRILHRGGAHSHHSRCRAGRL